MKIFGTQLRDWIRGSMRSWTMWVNAALIGLGGLELAGGHLSAFFGPEWTTKLIAIGGFANILLRIRTTVGLLEKGQQ